MQAALGSIPLFWPLGILVGPRVDGSCRHDRAGAGLPSKQPFPGWWCQGGSASGAAVRPGSPRRVGGVAQPLGVGELKGARHGHAVPFEGVDRCGEREAVPERPFALEIDELVVGNQSWKVTLIGIRILNKIGHMLQHQKATYFGETHVRLPWPSDSRGRTERPTTRKSTRPPRLFPACPPSGDGRTFPHKVLPHDVDKRTKAGEGERKRNFRIRWRCAERRV